MAAPPTAKPPRVKLRGHRQRLRAQGLRPIQIWVDWAACCEPSAEGVESS